MDDFALTPAERALFGALRTRGVRFLIVGMGAAVLEGAPVATQDIDLWFESLDTDQIKLAAEDGGGFWISGFGMQPPAFGGDELTQPGQRTLAFAHDVARTRLAMPPHQFGKCGLDAGRDLPAVARAATPAGVLGIQHQRVAAGARRLQRRMQAGVARADHHHVEARWQSGVGQHRARHMIPPVGC